jgi:hypothetical protein
MPTIADGDHELSARHQVARFGDFNLQRYDKRVGLSVFLTKLFWFLHLYGLHNIGSALSIAVDCRPSFQETWISGKLESAAK